MIVNMVAPWGTKYHYMSGIHTNVTTVQLPSGQAWYSYLWDRPQNEGNDPVNCVSVPSAVAVSGWREGGIGSMSAVAIYQQLFELPFIPLRWPAPSTVVHSRPSRGATGPAPVPRRRAS